MHSYAVTWLAFAASSAFAYTIHDAAKIHSSRDITDSIEDAYDFVVVGGGLAGLIMGGRLSEDSDHSVLVIEAGGNGDDFREMIDTPSQAYWGDLWNKEINWSFQVEPQAGLNGATMEWPRGKVLGGSSAINGLYLTRPGKAELDAWQGMLGDMDGAENWGWSSLFSAMKKSETFTPPSSAVAKTGGITYNAGSRGSSGPLQVSYPGFQSELNGMWASSNAAAGLPATNDAYGGDNWGGFICTSTINAANWTRSYSRSAYLDNIGPRSNYDLLVNALVTKLVFDDSGSDLSANAVEYSPDGGATKKTVKVKKEVILSGGSIGSPTVLQHSGVGPKDVLSAAGVKMISELPGVGQHLQDHASVQMNWKTTIPTVGDQRDQNSSPEFNSFVNDAVSFPGSKVLMGNGAGAVKSGIKSNMGKYAPADSTVNAGYEAIYKTNVDTIFETEIGQVEILMALTNDNSSVNIQITLQHPYSMGSVNIKSNDPTDYPAIDPNYLANPSDVDLFTAGVKFARSVSSGGQLGNVLTEISPGADVTSDADLEDFIRSNIYTEFHPSSTMAMLPKDQGGVVDANLRVYGTSNVRVADASVPPIEVSSHLMGSTYGIAEKASEIIKDYWKNGDPTISKSAGSSTNQHSANKARVRGGSAGGGDDNAGTNNGASLYVIAAFATVAAFMLGF